ncbi:carboxypeptidase-like regulatory domain-containing protein [Flavobacterium piscinae]|uniref:carboxypeptidase-like regulatory domain-containing protein n=1 Tax=Flavobacterium piscinae TaxID=2506424 RepID=UPI002AAC14E6|nr:carboxypeptidase-like regulatory domain-containing protein [Flavobacterium piscinae]
MKLKFLFFILFICSTVLAQKGTISGVLTDKDMNNEPLPFANVQIKGTTIGTTTDENGKYSLNVESGNYTLQLSFLGYETIEVPVIVKRKSNHYSKQSFNSRWWSNASRCYSTDNSES